MTLCYISAKTISQCNKDLTLTNVSLACHLVLKIFASIVVVVVVVAVVLAVVGVAVRDG